MISREYFAKHFDQQRRSLGDHPSVIFHLHSGASLIINAIQEYEDGYVLVDAYPEVKLDEKYEKRDRYAIPYESIADVQITLSKQKESDQMGFGSK